MNRYQNMDGAMRLSIYAGKFYMLGDVLLNGYIGEIYGHTESGKSQSSYTMRKVIVENNKVVSATGKITIYHVIATLGNGVNNNNNENSSANTNTQKIIKKDSNTNIKIEATSETIPNDMIMDVIEIESGETFNEIKDILVEINNFKAFDITLKSDDKNIQPNGKIKISIPIPVGFDASKLVVYRLDEKYNKTEYQVTVVNEYATFETDHFSTYVLGEKSKLSDEKNNGAEQSTETTQKNNEAEPSTETTTTENNVQNKTVEKDTKLPKTGEETNAFAKWLSIAIGLGIFWISSMLFIENEKKKVMKK